MTKRNDKGVGPYTDSDPGLRRDTSVDESGNPKVKPRSVFDRVENNTGQSAAIKRGLRA